MVSCCASTWSRPPPAARSARPLRPQAAASARSAAPSARATWRRRGPREIAPQPGRSSARSAVARLLGRARPGARGLAAPARRPSARPPLRPAPPARPRAPVEPRADPCLAELAERRQLRLQGYSRATRRPRRQPLAVAAQTLDLVRSAQPRRAATRWSCRCRRSRRRPGRPAAPGSGAPGRARRRRRPAGPAARCMRAIIACTSSNEGGRRGRRRGGAALLGRDRSARRRGQAARDRTVRGSCFDNVLPGAGVPTIAPRVAETNRAEQHSDCRGRPAVLGSAYTLAGNSTAGATHPWAREEQIMADAPWELVAGAVLALAGLAVRRPRHGAGRDGLPHGDDGRAQEPRPARRVGHLGELHRRRRLHGPADRRRRRRRRSPARPRAGRSATTA